MSDWSMLTPSAQLSGPTLVAYALFAVILIVSLARVLGSVMVRLGQPRVVGEILAGVLLGPTLLGSSLSEAIVPLQVRPTLSALAVLALILFMFLAGVEFDAGRIKGRVAQAALLGLVAVALPALLGFPLALAMHGAEYAGPAGAAMLPFALLIGAALSVTAFPVMAHILMERNELNSPIGNLAVASAGFMSAFMFTYIAFAAAVAEANGFTSLMIRIALMAGFAAVSWLLVKPLLERVLHPSAGGPLISGNAMAIILCGMIFYGWLGDRIGVSALVGGFVWGLILPASKEFRQAIAEKVRDISMILLLPIFFAIAGFSTDLKLLAPSTVPVIVLVLAAAIAGKFIAAAPARLYGLSWNDVGTLGTLFNTRGLLVLVVGLIGLDLAIITELTFTIFVIVALVTNMMTLPLLNLLSRSAPNPAFNLRSATE